MLRTIARLALYAAGAIALVLFAGWLLYALDANESQWLVAVVMDVARFFAEPFRFIFRLEDNVAQIAINWGIAALAYLLAAAVIGAVLTRVADAIERREDRRPAARSGQPAGS